MGTVFEAIVRPLLTIGLAAFCGALAYLVISLEATTVRPILAYGAIVVLAIGLGVYLVFERTDSIYVDLTDGAVAAMPSPQLAEDRARHIAVGEIVPDLSAATLGILIGLGRGFAVRDRH